MLVRLGFCSRGLRRLQMKAKLCSTDFLDLGHKYYPMLGSRMPRALLHSPESTVWARVPDHLGQSSHAKQEVKQLLLCLESKRKQFLVTALSST